MLYIFLNLSVKLGSVSVNGLRETYIVENWPFFTLCAINLNMTSISGTGNVQPVFTLDPRFMKHLWCDIVVSSINSFL